MDSMLNLFTAHNEFLGLNKLDKKINKEVLIISTAMQVQYLAYACKGWCS